MVLNISHEDKKKYKESLKPKEVRMRKKRSTRMSNKLKEQSFNLIRSIYELLIKTDASLSEINPLILTKEDNIVLASKTQKINL